MPVLLRISKARAGNALHVGQGVDVNLTALAVAPAPLVAASLVSGIRSITGAAIAPAPVASGHLVVAALAVGAVTAPAPVAAGVLKPVAVLAAQAVAPAPVASGRVLFSALVTAQAVAPAPLCYSRIAAFVPPILTLLSIQRRPPPHNALHLGGVIDAHLTAQAVAPAPVASGQISTGKITLVTAQAIAPTPVATALLVRVAHLAAVASAPAPLVTAQMQRVTIVRANVIAPAPVANVAMTYDVNLPSGAVSPRGTARWHTGGRASQRATVTINAAFFATGSGAARFTAARLGVNAASASWRGAAFAASAKAGAGWRGAVAAINHAEAQWCGAAFAASDTGGAQWCGAASASSATATDWRGLPLFTTKATAAFAGAAGAVTMRTVTWAAGAANRGAFTTWWNGAGYPRFIVRPPPLVVRPLPPLPLPSRLCVGGQKDGNRLHIGRRCGVENKRWYFVKNNAVLRLKGGVELPCTSMTIKVDSDSWCWAISASLFGESAYSLIAPTAPAFMPVEVVASVNGYEWEFVLDAPDYTRQFGKSTVAINGRGRAAWLAAPNAPVTSGAQSNPTTAAQAAVAAVADTGWTVDWTAADWLIPANLLTWTNATPLDRILSLAAVIDACVLADAQNAVIRVFPRYPEIPKNWVNLTPTQYIPDSAHKSLGIKTDNKTAYNQVFTGGTEHGVIVNAKLAGTAGDVAAPSVFELLLCDDLGVSAQARAKSVLSGSGKGSTIEADFLLQPTDALEVPRLMTPGDVVNLRGAAVLVRAVTINVDDGVVTQSVEFEQRDAA